VDVTFKNLHGFDWAWILPPLDGSWIGLFGGDGVLMSEDVPQALWITVGGGGAREINGMVGGNYQSAGEGAGDLADYDRVVRDSSGSLLNRESPPNENQREPALFIILPTSAGKTTTFLLPTKMKGSKTTVVITPLTWFGQQLRKTCIRFGLDVALFVKEQTRRTKVVIVVMESVGTNNFREFVIDLQLENRLDRVVWDECHMLVKEAHYRRNIAESLKFLLKCQLIFISATCPSPLVDEVVDLMRLPIPPRPLGLFQAQVPVFSAYMQ
jgi:hypothetical protein